MSPSRTEPVITVIGLNQQLLKGVTVFHSGYGGSTAMAAAESDFKHRRQLLD